MEKCWSLWLIFLALGCQTSFFPTQPHRSLEQYHAKGKNGGISTAHPLASEAGLAVLKSGGNAIDAAVAASLVISVVRPQSTGIGGGGFMLLYDAKSSTSKAYDFRERAPLLATRDMYADSEYFIYKGLKIPKPSINGHLAVGVPGLALGLAQVHRDHGSIPIEKLFTDAIKHAEEGIEVYPQLAEAIENRRGVLVSFAASRKIFLPGDKPLKVGDRLIQKDLGQTLRILQKNGLEDFYTGSIGKKIVDEMESANGLISKDDLKSYKVKTPKPLTGGYQGYQLLTMPPPSSGGVHILQVFNALEPGELESLGVGTTEATHLLTELLKRVFADRAKYLGDPEFVKVPIQGLLSQGYLKQLRNSIDMQKATPAKVLRNPDPYLYESPSTTHLTVVDKVGNVVSTTQTINYSFGSGVVAEGTGIILNNEMDDFSLNQDTPNVYGLMGSEANEIRAKKTMLSSMSPTLVLDSNGKFFLALGSPGGPKIITATLQVLLNVLEHKQSLLDAVRLYRVHHQWMPDYLQVEPFSLTKKRKKRLSLMGHLVKEAGEGFGDVHGIIKSAEGYEAVSDPRSDGLALAY